jgi:type IV pilus assembly protein PilC
MAWRLTRNVRPALHEHGQGRRGGWRVLDTVLERLSVFMEKAVKIKGKVVSAMVYPAIISLVAGGIMTVLMVFVVPKFQEVFFTMLKGKPLPWLTSVVVAIADAMRKTDSVRRRWARGGDVFLFWIFKRSKVGTKVIHWLLLRIPVLGDLLLKAAIARFTRTFGTLLASGVPILQALTITRDTSGNVHIANAINVVHDRVKEGDNVAKPLESTRIFPGMVTSMIEVGEETGALPDMLVRIADNYDEEVDNAVAALTSIIEPIMIVFMAVGVGIIVIAMFLPMVELIKSLCVSRNSRRRRPTIRCRRVPRADFRVSSCELRPGSRSENSSASSRLPERALHHAHLGVEIVDHRNEDRLRGGGVDGGAPLGFTLV